MSNAPPRLALLVDDDAGVRYGVRSLLEVLGYEVLEADDGPRATEIFDAIADRVSVVLLDRQLPGMGGDEVLVALRARRADVPIVVTSGEDLQGALPNGVRVLPKPFGIDELEGVLKAMA